MRKHPKTLFKYKKYFSLDKAIKFHYFCSNCFQEVSSSTPTCTNPVCLHDLCSNKGRSYFIEIPIVDQLRDFFGRPGFHKLLEKRLELDNDPHVISDVYSGKLHRDLVKEGFLNRDSVSFLMNTDGGPLFKSSNISIWPCLLIINELPFVERKKSDNLIMTGLWFGPKKPCMTLFLKPLALSMTLLHKGVEMQSFDRGKIVVKAAVIGCTCDLPARAIVANMNQYNGYYSCIKCLQEGEIVKTDKKGRILTFPYKSDSPEGPKRTDDTFLRDASTALDNGSAEHGVKGYTWMKALPKFSIVKGMLIDYMHGVCLGVIKTMLKLWFKPKYKTFPFNISNLVKVVDRRIKQLRPPIEITRTPRSIENDLMYWKASEFRDFMLYYSLPVLYKILPDEYYMHYSDLVRAMYILLRKDITVAQLASAREYIYRFCSRFEQLYSGSNTFTLNFHQLVHLPDDVRNVGPMFVYSAFLFESKMGLLMRMIQGTQYFDKQLVTAVAFVQKLPTLWSKLLRDNSPEANLIVRMRSRHKLKMKEKLAEGIFVLGGIRSVILTKVEAKLLASKTTQNLKLNARRFTRISIHGIPIYGREYSRLARRNNSYVRYTTASRKSAYAEVLYFLEVSENVAQTFAICKEVPTNENSRLHVKSIVDRAEILIAVDIKHIVEKCLYLYFDVDNVVCRSVAEFSNVLEGD